MNENGIIIKTTTTKYIFISFYFLIKSNQFYGRGYPYSLMFYIFTFLMVSTTISTMILCFLNNIIVFSL